MFSNNPEFSVWNAATESQVAIKNELKSLQSEYSFLKFSKEDFKNGVSITVGFAETTLSAYVIIDKYINGKDYKTAEIRISDHAPKFKSRNYEEFTYNELTPEIIRAKILTLIDAARK